MAQRIYTIGAHQPFARTFIEGLRARVFFPVRLKATVGCVFLSRIGEGNGQSMKPFIDKQKEQ